MGDLTEKVAVVTGASKGIGAAIAKALALAGAKTVVNYASDRGGAEQVVSEIRTSGGEALSFRADVADAGEVAALIGFAVKSFGGLDILVNNAGVYHLAPFEKIGEAEFFRMYKTNVLGPLLTMQASSPYLQAGSSIINIATNGVSTKSPGGSVYTSSKAALISMSQVIAKELGPRGVRVNVVCPGATDTEGVRAQGLIDGAVVQRLVANTPLGRMGRPEDIADPVLFLASDAARWITGGVLFASGGSR